MKFCTQRWGDKYDGYLYFFQRLEEMLFHYSDDIVKVPVHNTRTLIEEYLKNENEAQKGNVKPYQLEQISQELQESIKKDNILIKNLGNEFVSTVSDRIKHDKTDIIRFIKNKINGKTYFYWCKDYLQEHITEPKHKDEIEFGLRAWIVEIINYGYTPEYVYNYLRLCMKDVVHEPTELFKNFLNNFSFEKNSFRVYFMFSPNLLDYRELFSKRLTVCFDDDGYFSSIKTRKHDFIGYIDIDALDRYKAVTNSYKRIQTFIKYYRAISNRKNQLIRVYSYVRKLDEVYKYQIPIESIGFRSYETSPYEDIKKSVDYAIIGCQSNSSVTNEQINKILDIHNEVINQKNLNDAFINLWSILEIVVCDIPMESKIEKVIQGILPILEKDYFSTVLENIADDLEDNLSKKDYKNLIRELQPYDDIRYAIGSFIFSSKFEKLREVYFEKLKKYPVIRHKIYCLWVLRNSKSDIIKLSNKYGQRVKWHIYRLYRTRNAIVHSGENDKQIQALIEHLHIYVDQVIFEVLIKLAFEPTIGTFTDVIIDTKLLLSKRNGVFCDNSNITDNDIKMLLNSYYYESNSAI